MPGPLEMWSCNLWNAYNAFWCLFIHTLSFAGHLQSIKWTWISLNNMFVTNLDEERDRVSSFLRSGSTVLLFWWSILVCLRDAASAGPEGPLRAAVRDLDLLQTPHSSLLLLLSHSIYWNSWTQKILIPSLLWDPFLGFLILFLSEKRSKMK